MSCSKSGCATTTIWDGNGFGAKNGVQCHALSPYPHPSESLLQFSTYLDVDTASDLITVSGANLQIQDGTGSTECANEGCNGKGNFIVGYNEKNKADVHEGSHNIVAGMFNSYTDRAYGGLVVGNDNLISDKFVAVTRSGSHSWGNRSNAGSIAGGNGHACVGLPSGKVQCWGTNNYGQLGNKSNKASSRPVYVVNRKGTQLKDVIQVSGGGNTTCALFRNKAVQCWGDNSFGALGNNSTKNSSRAVSVLRDTAMPAIRLSGIEQIATGTNYSCALLSNHRVKCWGANDSGQLGIGSDDGLAHRTPVYVQTSEQDSTPLEGVTQIAAGGKTTCAVLLDKTVKCWGSNDSGQIGTGSMNRTEYAGPVHVHATRSGKTLLAHVQKVAVGHNHTCSLLEGGKVKCWGTNRGSTLTSNVYDSSFKTVPNPVFVSESKSDFTPLSNVIDISAGKEHTCGVLSDKRLKCWGRQWSGQLGHGSRSKSSYPRHVVTSGKNKNPLEDVVSVYAHDGYTCALLSSNEVKCWGDGTDSRLGPKFSGTYSSSPLTIPTK